MNTSLRGHCAPWFLGLGLFALAQAAFAGEFEGHWQLRDSNGSPFEIWLHPDGTADGTHNDAMKHGTWAQDGGAAVIHWTTGWTTRIAKDANGYSKTAYKPGTTPADKPSNSSEAKKLDSSDR